MKNPTQEQIRSVMAALGRRTSAKKAKSSAENGKKGGRPRKTVRVTIGPLLFDDYCKRSVFSFVEKAGTLDLLASEVREMIEDARFQTAPDGPDELPSHYRKAYTRLLAQFP